MDTENRIQAVKGDITGFAVDAIVNAANQSLLGGGGVDGAIHRAAGPELLAECRTIGGCPVGEARITKGYRLKAGYVIHTVGPIYRGRPKDASDLARCYRNVFRLVAENSIRTIAFPAISCGVYGYPIADACRIALLETVAALASGSEIDRVYFVLFSDKDLDVYLHAMGSFLSKGE